jgi:hypothetical protein
MGLLDLIKQMPVTSTFITTYLYHKSQGHENAGQKACNAALAVGLAKKAIQLTSRDENK